MKLPRCCSIPANESQLTVALVFSVAMMGLMLSAIIWQANVIAQQAAVIHWLWTAGAR